MQQSRKNVEQLLSLFLVELFPKYRGHALFDFGWFIRTGDHIDVQAYQACKFYVHQHPPTDSPVEKHYRQLCEFLGNNWNAEFRLRYDSLGGYKSPGPFVDFYDVLFDSTASFYELTTKEMEDATYAYADT